MARVTIRTKISLLLVAVAVVASGLLMAHLYRTAIANAKAVARQDAMTHIGRSVAMFVVTTEKFHADFQATAGDPAARKRILDDWNRTIFAFNQAVVADHGADQPRIRLIGGEDAFRYPPLGGVNTRVESEFERTAARRLMSGDSIVEVIEGGHLRVAVPLWSQAHAGCAACHFAVLEGERAEMDKQILLGSANAYMPLAGPLARARNDGLRAGALIFLAFGLLIGLLSFAMDRMIVQPIRFITRGAKRLARGDLAMESGDEHTGLALQGRGDELGEISRAFGELTQSQSAKAEAADRIAAGDLSTSVVLAGERDRLGHAMVKLVRRLEEVNKDVAGLTDAALQGNWQARAEVGRHEGRYAEMVGGVNALIQAMAEPVTEALAVLQKVAQRDLTVRMEGEFRGDYALLKTSVNGALENLEEALTEVAAASSQVAEAADEIAGGSQSLAAGTSDQASSLEQVSSSLQELGSMARQSADNAREARALSDAATDSAVAGEEAMSRLSAAVHRSKESSDATGRIVKTIDGIAFQTNLLALNAAVEAARAGDAGNGFAVVADEVRSLAMRSAAAAKDTAALIEKSLAASEEGVSAQAEVASRLDQIRGAVTRVREVMAEISAASEQQTEGVDQINQAVDEMNALTQRSAASSQESAGAAEELSGQAQRMAELVDAFALSRNRAATGARRAAPRGHAVQSGSATGRGSRSGEEPPLRNRVAGLVHEPV